MEICWWFHNKESNTRFPQNISMRVIISRIVNYTYWFRLISISLTVFCKINEKVWNFWRFFLCRKFVSSLPEKFTLFSEREGLQLWRSDNTNKQSLWRQRFHPRLSREDEWWCPNHLFAAQWKMQGFLPGDLKIVMQSSSSLQMQIQFAKRIMRLELNSLTRVIMGLNKAQK